MSGALSPTAEAKILKEEQIRVLRAIKEATKSMDMKTFAQNVSLTPEEAVEQIQELAKNAFLRKIGKGYAISEKGKAAIKAFNRVPDDRRFLFYVGIGQPTGFNAKTVEEFYRLTKQVCVESIEFHLFRGDFERWINDVLEENEFAVEVGNLKNSQLKGETLRTALLNLFETKYGFEELT